MNIQSSQEFFQQELAFGRRYEKLARGHVIRYIERKHDIYYKLKSIRHDGEFDFDLIDAKTGSIISFEVKTDRSSRRTNNYYIEYNNGFGKPTGINITKANYHIITDEIDFYLISTKKLKDIVAEGNWRTLATKKTFYNSGKTGKYSRITSYGHIIPKETIISQAKRIN